MRMVDLMGAEADVDVGCVGFLYWMVGATAGRESILLLQNCGKYSSKPSMCG